MARKAFPGPMAYQTLTHAKEEAHAKKKRLQKSRRMRRSRRMQIKMMHAHPHTG